jgi:hypothetical protein
MDPQPPTPPQAQIEFMYTEQHETNFRERAKKLTLAALSSHFLSKPRRPNAVCWEVAVPKESADELIAEAMRRRNYE